MKVYLKKVRLNQGGYTDSGQYFGIGSPLYYYEPVEGSQSLGDSGYIRAKNRDHAKKMVTTFIPNATFFR